MEAASPSDLAENFVGRLRGYFVPPRDAEYRFRVRGDDVTRLFFSDTGDETNMVCIIEVRIGESTLHANFLY